MEGDCKRKLWVLSMVMKQRWEYWRSVMLKPMEIDASTLSWLKSIRTCFVELQTKQVLMLIILNYSEKPLSFFLWTAPNPTFCVPSQFVSWSAQPLEPPSETYVSALHDIWSTKARKLSMALSVNWTSFVAKSFVQLVTHILRGKIRCHFC